MNAPIPDHFWPLLDAACDGTLTREQWSQLQACLDDHREAQEIFVDHFLLCTQVNAWWKGERSCLAGLDRLAERLDDDAGRAIRSIRQSFECRPSLSVPGASGWFWPTQGSILAAYIGSFLMVAAGLAAAWAWHMPAVRQVAQPAISQATSIAKHAPPIVGKLTAMSNCDWAKPKAAPKIGQNVSVGQVYVLNAGAVMELTYDLGARVTLYGPAVYDVDIPNGGFLFYGRVIVHMEGEAGGVGTPTRQSAPARQLAGPKTPPEVAGRPFFAVRSGNLVKPHMMVGEPGGEFTMRATKATTEGFAMKSPVWMYLSQPAPVKWIYLSPSLMVAVDAKGKTWAAVGGEPPSANVTGEAPAKATVSSEVTRTLGERRDEQRTKAGSPDS